MQPSSSETIAKALYSVMLSKWAPSSCGIFCIISFSLTQSTIHWKKLGLKGTWENSQCLISSNNGTHSINLSFYIKSFLSYLYLYACLLVFTFNWGESAVKINWDPLRTQKNLLTEQNGRGGDKPDKLNSGKLSKDEAFYPINCRHRIYETK